MTITTPTDTAIPTEVAVEALAAHPDNPRRQLGDLTEGSGFHLMRGSRGGVNSEYRACSLVAGAWRASPLLVEIGRGGIRD